MHIPKEEKIGRERERDRKKERKKERKKRKKERKTERMKERKKERKKERTIYIYIYTCICIYIYHYLRTAFHKCTQFKAKGLWLSAPSPKSRRGKTKAGSTT